VTPATTAQQLQWQALKKQSTSGDCGDSSRSVSNGTASKRRGQQETTDLPHRQKSAIAAAKQKQGRSMDQQGFQQVQQVATTMRGLQTLWCSEQQR